MYIYIHTYIYMSLGAKGLNTLYLLVVDGGN